MDVGHPVRLSGIGSGRCGLLAGAVAGVHDGAGLFPGGDEGAAGFGGVVLDDEVVEVGDGGGEFPQEGGALDDAGARGGICGGEGVAGGAEGGDEVGVAEFLVVAEFVVHAGEAGEVAGFLEVAGEGAGGFVAGGLKGLFGGVLGIGMAAGGGGGAGGEFDGAPVACGEGGEFVCEGEGRLVLPDGLVLGGLGDVDAGLDGVEAVGDEVVHGGGGLGMWVYGVFWF